MVTLNKSYPKGSAKEAFDERGAEYAIEIAKKLGIAESRYSKWLKEWSGEIPAKSAPKAPPVGKEAKQPREKIKKGPSAAIKKAPKEGSRSTSWEGVKVIINNAECAGKKYKGTEAVVVEKTSQVTWPFKVRLFDGKECPMDRKDFDPA